MSGGLPEVRQEFFPLSGGMDQLTPAIALKSGMVIDACNFEPEINGGYRRRAGYERFDGHASPTSASYAVLTANITGSVAIGNTLTGATSGATGKVLGIHSTTIVLGRVTGTFVSGENLTVAAVVQAVATSASVTNGAASPSDDADYKLLAANDLRLDISAVPGSGPIRGVWIYNDVVYAFRDNAGGTAGAIYRSSASGWQLVSLGTELQFSSATGGTTPIAVGATIGNAAAPTKTATVLAVVTRTGTWGTDAVGTLIITPVTGSWSSAEAIYVGATQKAVSTAAATAITRLPGGRVECVNANFTSSTNTLKMYGCDGVNTAFEFDGIVYAPIRTGMATDTPSHIMFHRFYLFLSFRGSAQYSAIGNPYAWSVILGAGEIACADDITGFLPQTGNTAGSSMAIFTRTRTYILYGSTAASWNLVVSNFDIGYSAYTLQPVSNNTYGLTARGVQCLLTTLTYGDFDFVSISHPVTPFVVQRRGGEIASTSLRTKDQYRLYYNDGYCLVIGLSGDKVSGMMPLNYNRVVRCIVTQTLSTGEEVTYFGSDDGYIYRDNIGTSYDGSAFEYWVRMAFNHSKSPQIRKRYRRAVMEVYAYGYCQVSVTYDLGYSNPNVMTPAAIPSQNLSGGGGYWDQFTWDSFSWDSQLVEQPRISMTGTERNVSFLFYGNRAQDQQFTLQGITIFYTSQRIER